MAALSNEVGLKRHCSSLFHGLTQCCGTCALWSVVSTAVWRHMVALSKPGRWWEPWSRQQLLALLEPCLTCMAPFKFSPFPCGAAWCCSVAGGCQAPGWHARLCTFAGMGLYCAGGTPSLVEGLNPFILPSVHVPSEQSEGLHSTRVPGEHQQWAGSSLCHAHIAAAPGLPQV